MDRVELHRQWSEATMENTALKAEVARLKLQNESLEIRLTAVHDKVASLQQFIEGETVMRREAEAALQAANNVTVENEALKAESSRLKTKIWGLEMQIEEDTKAPNLATKTLRRVCPHLTAPGKALRPAWTQTALAALDLVKRWDRDECVADLKRQHAKYLRTIEDLKSGRDILMDDVVRAMNEDGRVRMMAEFDESLHHVLRELREQLSVIFEGFPTESAHDEWFKYPLNMFILDYVEGSDVDESSDMDVQ